jgi:hypothetical protein
LRNRFYIGEVNYKGEIYPGEQPSILDRDLFDRVQKTFRISGVTKPEPGPPSAIS